MDLAQPSQEQKRYKTNSAFISHIPSLFCVSNLTRKLRSKSSVFFECRSSCPCSPSPAHLPPCTTPPSMETRHPVITCASASRPRRLENGSLFYLAPCNRPRPVPQSCFIIASSPQHTEEPQFAFVLFNRPSCGLSYASPCW